MRGSSVFDGNEVTAGIEGRVARISLARMPVNAFRTATWEELDTALGRVEATQASVVLLSSSVPGIFSAGADVKELPMSPELDEQRQALTRSVLAHICDLAQPVIVVVDGPALGGGCAIACAADIRIGSPAASFGLPEINVGRCGGGRYLMRHLPQGTVRRLYFTGEQLGAEDALQLGLLDSIEDDVDAASEALAARIAAKSPSALKLAKQSLNLAERVDLQTGYAIEQQFSLRLAGTADAAEAAAAFRERRDPVWTSGDQGQ